MNAKRRINANDISKRSDLSNTFIVAMTRHVPGIGRTSACVNPCCAPAGTRAHSSRARSTLVGKLHCLPRQHREQLAERAVEVRPVELVDDEPFVLRIASRK